MDSKAGHSRKWTAGIGISLAAALGLQAAEYQLDTVSVTATKVERKSSEVPQNISVVDSAQLEDQKLIGVTDVLQGIPGVVAESKNGGYDARLILRGAGLKAAYGVREIMVLRDGVPLTDPDSFTRLDFVDTQDIERIEVTKGPGSIFAAGTSGGTVQIISKSVFDEQKNRIKLGGGNDGARNLNVRYGGAVDDSNFYNFTFSHRGVDNNWRENNDFSTLQGSLKYGHFFEDGSALEGEFAMTKSNMQLPSKMNEEEFQQFKDDGEQPTTSEIWQDNGRYSTIYFTNLRYEKEMDNLTFKPRVYFNHWEHLHPVPGMINDADNNNVFGVDLELNYAHTLLGQNSQLVAGLTRRMDSTNDSKKYQYADRCLQTQTSTGWGGATTTEILRTSCDDKGDLAEIQDSTTALVGFYAQESMRFGEKWLLDIALRADRTKFDIEGDQTSAFDWSTDGYKAGIGAYDFSKSYTLLSKKMGLSYQLVPGLNAYASIAQSDQTPGESEIRSNISNGGPELDAPQSTSYEIGLKGRGESYAYDLAFYVNPVEDEIISSYQEGQTLYQNAGKTDKKGLELEANYLITPEWSVGGSYAYQDYTYDEFTEIVYGRNTANVDRSGNQLPYIPKHQYGLNLGYKNDSGWRGRLAARSYGEYYMDNANTEKYEGYDFVTDLMVGWEHQAHNVTLNVDNLFDSHYAAEAKKSVSGEKSYAAATPRSIMLTYSYRF